MWKNILMATIFAALVAFGVYWAYLDFMATYRIVHF